MNRILMIDDGANIELVKALSDDGWDIYKKGEKLDMMNMESIPQISFLEKIYEEQMRNAYWQNKYRRSSARNRNRKSNRLHVSRLTKKKHK